MEKTPSPIFLERDRYRRRRWADAAKLLPVIGLVIWLLPTLWAESGSALDSIFYVFGAWAILIVTVLVISVRVVRNRSDERETTNRQFAEQEET